MAAWFSGLSQRKPQRIPEPHGLKAMEIGSNSVYLRWSFLSSERNSLSAQQLDALIFEFRTMDKELISECHFKKTPRYEYKARLNGLKSSTKYRFQIRCKLRYEQEMLYSAWSNRIEFRTKPTIFTITTDQDTLNIESVKFQLTECQTKLKEMEIERDELRLKLKKFSPAHHEWGPDKIVEWIMRIQNGIFKPYKKTLYKHLKEEGITGNLLCQIDINDLKRFGVTSFAHKKILMQHLAKLTENDKVPEYQYDADLARTITTPQSIQLRQKSRLSHDYDEDEPGMANHSEEKIESKMIFPKQTTHFSPPNITDLSSHSEEDNMNNKYSFNKPQPRQISHSSTEPFVDSVIDNLDGKEQIVQSKTDPLSMKDIGSNSYGLTKSVKNLLISSPSNEPPKKWKYKNGVLSVKVIKATDVDNMDTDEDASDPYVELEIKGHFRKEKTKVIYNDANPVWNERFQLFPENPKKDILKCKIWDKDTWTFDDKIGSVYIPVIDVLNANGYINKAFDVRGSQTGAKLYIELKYKELEH